MQEIKLPMWAWSAFAFILCSFTGGLGTWVGYTLFDHEKRLVQIESTKFTNHDGKVMLNELKIDIQSDIGDLKNDINALRLDFIQVRRDIDRIPAK